MSTTTHNLGTVAGGSYRGHDAPHVIPGKAVGSALVALSVYLVWALVTYLLEGSRHTLLKPDARDDRFVYALFANVLAGTLLPLLVLRWLARHGRVAPRLAEFCTARRTASSLAIAAALGIGVLLPLMAVTRDPWVYANVFALVVPVCVAEVTTCWVLIGASIETSLGRGTTLGAAVRWLVGAALFGVYHFAHSPPYDTWRMVAVLGAIGLLTGAFFLISGELYGTILFHGSLATAGVLRSLSDAQLVAQFGPPRADLCATGAGSVVLLILLDVLLSRDRARGQESQSRLTSLTTER